jgi:hypothetical protein
MSMEPSDASRQYSTKPPLPGVNASRKKLSMGCSRAGSGGDPLKRQRITAQGLFSDTLPNILNKRVLTEPGGLG